MLYGLLADLTAVVHGCFVVYVLFGALLVLKWRVMAWPHLLAAAWGAGIEFSGGICPLTPLELWLRAASGGEGYEGDFIARYLLPILYPADLTRRVQILLGLLVIVINLAIYTWILRRTKAGG